MVLSTFGVIYLLLKGEISNVMHIPINIGDLWALGSAASWACYCAFLRIREKKMSQTDLANFASPRFGSTEHKLTPKIIKRAEI